MLRWLSLPASIVATYISFFELISVATPALVVWGRDDRIVPLECGERYAKALASAKLAIVEGAGHLVDLEKPAELARLVVDFATAN